ncbi:hypothetical protein HOF26_01620 [bacterium]|nr:hypothetical protein [bacterium]
MRDCFSKIRLCLLLVLVGGFVGSSWADFASEEVTDLAEKAIEGTVLDGLEKTLGDGAGEMVAKDLAAELGPQILKTLDSDATDFTVNISEDAIKDSIENVAQDLGKDVDPEELTEDFKPTETTSDVTEEMKTNISDAQTSGSAISDSPSDTINDAQTKLNNAADKISKLREVDTTGMSDADKALHEEKLKTAMSDQIDKNNDLINAVKEDAKSSEVAVTNSTKTLDTDVDAFEKATSNDSELGGSGGNKPPEGQTKEEVVQATKDAKKSLEESGDDLTETTKTEGDSKIEEAKSDLKDKQKMLEDFNDELEKDSKLKDSDKKKLSKTKREELVQHRNAQVDAVEEAKKALTSQFEDAGEAEEAVSKTIKDALDEHLEEVTPTFKSKFKRALSWIGDKIKAGLGKLIETLALAVAFGIPAFILGSLDKDRKGAASQKQVAEVVDFAGLKFQIPRTLLAKNNALSGKYYIYMAAPGDTPTHKELWSGWGLISGWIKRFGTTESASKRKPADYKYNDRFVPNVDSTSGKFAQAVSFWKNTTFAVAVDNYGKIGQVMIGSKEAKSVLLIGGQGAGYQMLSSGAPASPDRPMHFIYGTNAKNGRNDFPTISDVLKEIRGWVANPPATVEVNKIATGTKSLPSAIKTTTKAKAAGNKAIAYVMGQQSHDKKVTHSSGKINDNYPRTLLPMANSLNSNVTIKFKNGKAVSSATIVKIDKKDKSDESSKTQATGDDSADGSDPDPSGATGIGFNIQGIHSIPAGDKVKTPILQIISNQPKADLVEAAFVKAGPSDKASKESGDSEALVSANFVAYGLKIYQTPHTMLAKQLQDRERARSLEAINRKAAGEDVPDDQAVSYESMIYDYVLPLDQTFTPVELFVVQSSDDIAFPTLILNSEIAFVWSFLDNRVTNVKTGKLFADKEGPVTKTSVEMVREKEHVTEKINAFLDRKNSTFSASKDPNLRELGSLFEGYGQDGSEAHGQVATLKQMKDDLKVGPFLIGGHEYFTLRSDFYSPPETGIAESENPNLFIYKHELKAVRLSRELLLYKSLHTQDGHKLYTALSGLLRTIFSNHSNPKYKNDDLKGLYGYVSAFVSYWYKFNKLFKDDLSTLTAQQKQLINDTPIDPGFKGLYDKLTANMSTFSKDISDNKISIDAALKNISLYKDVAGGTGQIKALWDQVAPAYFMVVKNKSGADDFEHVTLPYIPAEDETLYLVDLVTAYMYDYKTFSLVSKTNDFVVKKVKGSTPSKYRVFLGQHWNNLQDQERYESAGKSNAYKAPLSTLFSAYDANPFNAKFDSFSSLDDLVAKGGTPGGDSAKKCGPKLFDMSWGLSGPRYSGANQSLFDYLCWLASGHKGPNARKTAREFLSWLQVSHKAWVSTHSQLSDQALANPVQITYGKKPEDVFATMVDGTGGRKVWKTGSVKDALYKADIFPGGFLAFGPSLDASQFGETVDMKTIESHYVANLINGKVYKIKESGKYFVFKKTLNISKLMENFELIDQSKLEQINNAHDAIFHQQFPLYFGPYTLFIAQQQLASNVFVYQSVPVPVVVSIKKVKEFVNASSDDNRPNSVNWFKAVPLQDAFLCARYATDDEDSKLYLPVSENNGGKKCVIDVFNAQKTVFLISIVTGNIYDDTGKRGQFGSYQKALQDALNGNADASSSQAADHLFELAEQGQTIDDSGYKRLKAKIYKMVSDYYNRFQNELKEIEIDRGSQEDINALKSMVDSGLLKGIVAQARAGKFAGNPNFQKNLVSYKSRYYLVRSMTAGTFVIDFSDGRVYEVKHSYDDYGDVDKSSVLGGEIVQHISNDIYDDKGAVIAGSTKQTQLEYIRAIHGVVVASGGSQTLGIPNEFGSIVIADLVPLPVATLKDMTGNNKVNHKFELHTHKDFGGFWVKETSGSKVERYFEFENGSYLDATSGQRIAQPYPLYEMEAMKTGETAKTFQLRVMNDYLDMMKFKSGTLKAKRRSLKLDNHFKTAPVGMIASEKAIMTLGKEEDANDMQDDSSWIKQFVIFDEVANTVNDSTRPTHYGKEVTNNWGTKSRRGYIFKNAPSGNTERAGYGVGGGSKRIGSWLQSLYSPQLSYPQLWSIERDMDGNELERYPVFTQAARSYAPDNKYDRERFKGIFAPSKDLHALRASYISYGSKPFKYDKKHDYDILVEKKDKVITKVIVNPIGHYDWAILNATASGSDYDLKGTIRLPGDIIINFAQVMTTDKDAKPVPGKYSMSVAVGTLTSADQSTLESSLAAFSTNTKKVYENGYKKPLTVQLSDFEVICQVTDYFTGSQLTGDDATFDEAAGDGTTDHIDNYNMYPKSVRCQKLKPITGKLELKTDSDTKSDYLKLTLNNVKLPLSGGGTAANYELNYLYDKEFFGRQLMRRLYYYWGQFLIGDSLVPLIKNYNSVTGTSVALDKNQPGYKDIPAHVSKTRVPQLCYDDANKRVLIKLKKSDCDVIMATVKADDLIDLNSGDILTKIGDEAIPVGKASKADTTYLKIKHQIELKPEAELYQSLGLGKKSDWYSYDSDAKEEDIDANGRIYAGRVKSIKVWYRLVTPSTSSTTGDSSKAAA